MANVSFGRPFGFLSRTSHECVIGFQATLSRIFGVWEGEVMILLYQARRLLRASTDSSHPSIDEALQALDRADTVMREAARRGAEAEMMELRRLRYEPLERRLRELSAQSPPGGAELPSEL